MQPPGHGGGTKEAGKEKRGDPNPQLVKPHSSLSLSWPREFICLAKSLGSVPKLNIGSFKTSFIKTGSKRPGKWGERTLNYKDVRQRKRAQRAEKALL